MKLRSLLAQAGFEIPQWASNQPEVLCHLPKEAKSDSSESWVSQTHGEAQEMTLCFSWHFMEDTLHYRHRPVAPSQTTMHNIYKILASQYDPQGYILPFTTKAKVLVQKLWAKAGMTLTYQLTSCRPAAHGKKSSLSSHQSVSPGATYLQRLIQVPSPSSFTSFVTHQRQHMDQSHTYVGKMVKV